MHDVVLDLLILLAGIWLVAVTLRPLGLPTIMGELIVGVLVGPAVFGLIEPSEAITLLAEIGIFFLMFHAGVETQPTEFFDALKRSLGVALVGAIVPFGVGFALLASVAGLGYGLAFHCAGDRLWVAVSLHGLLNCLHLLLLSYPLR